MSRRAWDIIGIVVSVALFVAVFTYGPRWFGHPDTSPGPSGCGAGPTKYDC